MYQLGVLEYPQLPVRVDDVVEVRDKNSGEPCLNAVATVQFRGVYIEQRQLVLYADMSCKNVLVPEVDFVLRTVSIAGYPTNIYRQNPLASVPLVLRHFFFEDAPDNARGRIVRIAREVVSPAKGADPLVNYLNGARPRHPASMH